MNIFTKGKGGFTLIELLVVIAIVAVLAVAVILTLNPAELLKQARDSTRISDLNTVKSAVALYLADVSSPVLSFNGSYDRCGASVASTSQTPCEFRHQGISVPGGIYVTTSTQDGIFANDGTGWVPVNFGQITSGAPIGGLPRDPSNVAGGATSTNLFYDYVASSSLTFELDAKMESAKYSSGGASDVETTDGGNQNRTGAPGALYEVGLNVNL